MKQLFQIILVITATLLSSQNANAQIALEATYDSASSNFYMVTLEIEGEKFVKVQRTDSTMRFIKLYNLNHSLWKTIDCNSLPMFTFLMGTTLNSSRFNYEVLYITEHLFDNDDDIEFLYGITTGICPQHFTGIYNEDGTAIFTQDSAFAVVHLNVPVVAKPIYNTVNGTKLILSFPCSNEAKVYSLPGISTNSNMYSPENTDASLLAYPNPSSNQTTIEYNLPDGLNRGEIVLYNLNGTELKRYNVDRTFNNLILNNTDLPVGTYLYQLVTVNGISESKKMIIIK